MPASQPSTSSRLEIYSRAARGFHWWTVLLVLILVPTGLTMTYRGGTLNIWDATTNRLYSLHKLLGFTLLLLVIARLVYRFRKGAPADEPTLEWWQKAASHLTHWGLYALLLLVPMLGWIGIQLYPAREVFGLFSLPAFLSPNQGAAGQVFFLHKLAGIALMLLVAAHFGAAMFHHFIRKDGVLRRMLPTKADRENQG